MDGREYESVAARHGSAFHRQAALIEGEQILEEAGDNTRFDLKSAEEIADEIARKLFGLWDWRVVLEVVYAPSGLGSLANQWLHNQAPALAYAVVLEIDYPGHTSKYVSVNQRGDDEVMI